MRKAEDALKVRGVELRRVRQRSPLLQMDEPFVAAEPSSLTGGDEERSAERGRAHHRLSSADRSFTFVFVFRSLLLLSLSLLGAHVPEEVVFRVFYRV